MPTSYGLAQYELLQQFSLQELFTFFGQKYPQVQVFHVVRCLT